MRPDSNPWHSQSLYITDLAQHFEEMEHGKAPEAVAYRLFARRLQAALAGYPEPMAAQLGGSIPCVMHALSQRHFDVHGAFNGAAAARARLSAMRLFRRLGCIPPR